MGSGKLPHTHLSPPSSDPLTILLRTSSSKTSENPVFEAAGKVENRDKASKKPHDGIVQPAVLHRGLDVRLEGASKNQDLTSMLSWTTK